MPKRSRSQSGRQTWAKKSRRGIRRPAWMRPRRSQFLSVVRGTSGNYATGTTSVDTFQGNNFTLSSLPNYTEFTSMFDAYKIVKIQYRFRLYKNPDVVAPNLYPVIYHVVDYNDAAAPTSVNQVLEYPLAKTTILNDSKPVSAWFSFKPKNSGLVSSASFAAVSPWVDTGSASALYYGMKSACTQMSTGINIAIDYRFTVWLKNVK